MITTNRLAKLYDRLTIWERIPLLISANAREDDAEYRRLFETSPSRPSQFSEHLLAEQSLHLFTLIYITEQLDAAAIYFFAQWQMEHGEASGHDDWLLVSDICSYFFTVNAAAWRRFCAGLAIDSDVLTASNYRGWFLQLCQERMPGCAPAADELATRMRRAGRGAVQLVTSDSLLADWQNLLHQATGHTVRDSARATP